MLNFKEWANKEIGEEVPKHNIGDYIICHGLPMVVSCTCCGSTIALPSAWINENDEIFCSACAGKE